MKLNLYSFKTQLIHFVENDVHTCELLHFTIFYKNTDKHLLFFESKARKYKIMLLTICVKSNLTVSLK